MKYITKGMVIDHAHATPQAVFMDVVEEDKQSIFSGLYNARGEPLFRQAETVPMGFRKH